MRAGFRQVRQYYAFKTGHCERVSRNAYPTSKDKFRCPACQRLFTEMALADHTCLGGAAGYPKLEPSKYSSRDRSTTNG